MAAIGVYNFFENYSKFFLTDEGAKLVNNEKLELNEETNKSLEKEKKSIFFVFNKK